MASMNRLIGRMAAENSILNTDSGQKARDAQAQSAQDFLAVKNDMKDLSNEMNSFATTVSIVQSAVQKGSTVQAKFQAAGDAMQAQQTVPQAQGAIDSGSAPNASTEGGDSTAALAAVRLGEDGPTVGERFAGGQQLQTLANPGEVNRVIQANTGPDGKLNEEGAVREFMNRGFTEGEAKDLVAGAKNGWDSKEAAQFAWDHRKTEGQQRQEQIRNAIQSELVPALIGMLSSNISSTAGVYGDRAKKFGESSQKLDDAANRTADQWVSTNDAMREQDLQAIRKQHSGKPGAA